MSTTFLQLHTFLTRKFFDDGISLTKYQIPLNYIDYGLYMEYFLFRKRLDKVEKFFGTVF